MEQRYKTIINMLACIGNKGGLFSTADLAHVAALLSCAEQKIEAGKAG